MKLIVAIGKDGSIGKKGDLIWRIPEDLKRFKALTMGHPVIMGRKTWESLPKKPLPGRRNIVVTRQKDFGNIKFSQNQENYVSSESKWFEIANSVEEAVELTHGEAPFIIGGAEIYKAFMPYVDEMYLTSIDNTCAEADAYLHLTLDEDWELTEESEMAQTAEGVRYRYQTYSKISK